MCTAIRQAYQDMVQFEIWNLDRVGPHGGWIRAELREIHLYQDFQLINRRTFNPLQIQYSARFLPPNYDNRPGLWVRLFLTKTLYINGFLPIYKQRVEQHIHYRTL